MTEPASWPVIVLVATPVGGGRDRADARDGAGAEALAKLTTVVLSEVTVLPAAS